MDCIGARRDKQRPIAQALVPAILPLRQAACQLSPTRTNACTIGIVLRVAQEPAARQLRPNDQAVGGEGKTGNHRPSTVPPQPLPPPRRLAFRPAHLSYIFALSHPFLLLSLLSSPFQTYPSLLSLSSSGPVVLWPCSFLAIHPWPPLLFPSPSLPSTHPFPPSSLPLCPLPPLPSLPSYLFPFPPPFSISPTLNLSFPQTPTSVSCATTYFRPLPSPWQQGWGRRLCRARTPRRYVGFGREYGRARSCRCGCGCVRSVGDVRLRRDFGTLSVRLCAGAHVGILALAWSASAGVWHAASCTSPRLYCI